MQPSKTFKHAMIAGAIAVAMGTAGVCAADDTTNSKTTPPVAPSQTASKTTPNASGSSMSNDTARPMTGKEKATAVGAGTGAVAGAVVGGPVGAVVGAGIGAAVGHEGTDANGNVTKTGYNDSKHWSAHNNQVRKVQTALNDQGFNVEVDGRMGPQTESAVKSFQEKNGLTQTGTLDDQTLNKLGVSG